MKKRWKQELRHVLPLDYFIFRNVPMRSSNHGDVIDMDLSILELYAAKAIITLNLPIYGAEVKFLRKCIGLSLEKFATKLDLSAATVLKWEQKEKIRLHLVNEIAVKIFIAEKLGLTIDLSYSEFVTTQKSREIYLKAS